MSDDWYKDPVELPPYEDWLGRKWTLDGVCLNPDPPLNYPYRSIAEWFDSLFKERIKEAEEELSKLLYLNNFQGLNMPGLPPPHTWPEPLKDLITEALKNGLALKTSDWDKVFDLIYGAYRVGVATGGRVPMVSPVQARVNAQEAIGEQLSWRPGYLTRGRDG